MKFSFLHTYRGRPFVVLAGLLLLLIFRDSAVVHAHSEIIRAEPGQNSILTIAPEQVVIWFTESLETRFGEIQVLDAAGQRVDNGNSTVDPQDRTKMTVTLQSLSNGTYSVVWTNVSTVDGHRVRGSYLFSVGEPIGAFDLTVLADQPSLQSPFEPIFRWLTLLSIMAIVGGLVFRNSVLRPALALVKSAKSTEQLDQELVRRATLLNWAAIGLFFLASIGYLILQVSITFELSFFQSLGQPLTAMLFETNWGKLWLIRMALALTLAVLLWLTAGSTRKSSSGKSGIFRGYNPADLTIGVLGLLILLTISLTSHAAATEDIRLATTLNDYLHMLAAAVWVGGLFHFATALPLVRRDLTSNQQKRLLAAMVPRFSILGITAVAVTVVTGLYSAWVQVTLPIALATPYGRVLMVKVGLAGLVFTLAAANHLWIRPRLAKDPEAGRRLRRLVTAEAALALVILLAVGLLTALEPARQVASRQRLVQEEKVLSETIDGSEVELAIIPGQIGLNQITVTLRDPDNQPIVDVTDVTLRPAFLENDLGMQSVSAARVENGQYQVDDIFLNLPGLWQIALTARLPGSSDVRTAFRFELGQASREDSSTISPDKGTGRLLWAAEIALLGLVLVITGVLMNRRRRRGILVTLPGIAAFTFAAFLALTAPTSEPDVAKAALPRTDVNPFLPDNDSIGQGQHVYEDHCMICHGLTGHGDGPRSAGIDAVDIIEHVPLHADIDYFEIVAAHRQRGDLAQGSGDISVDDIWHLINYLHAFEADQLLAESYFSQARDLAEQGEITGALAGLDQAIELSPRFVQALQGRGIIYLDQRKFDQALAEFDQIIALDPSFPESYYYRAEAYHYAERWLEAIDEYTHALDLEPNRGQAYYGRALAYIEAGQPGEAIADLQYYLAIAPSADQTFIEQLIAELQASPAQFAESQAAVTLSQSDLPTGFEELPAANLGLVEGQPISIGTVIASSFAFGHRDHFELIWGYSTRLLTEEDQAVFDDMLNESALLAFLSEGLGTAEFSEATSLSAPPELGNASAKLAAVFDSNRQQSRVEGVAFRRDGLGILLFIASVDGTNSTSELDSLARILNGRAKS